MSKKELDRPLVVEKCAGKAFPQLEEVRLLGISVRQLPRIKRFRAEGASDLASKHRDCPANNEISDTIRQHALGLVRTHYNDFGPTLAHEHLSEQHGCQFNQYFAKPPRKPENLHRPVHHSAEE